jgi:ABC-type phosphate transport system substrate-binding protein
MSAARRRLPLLAFLAALVILPGCGVSLEGASSAGDSGPVQRTTASGSSEQQAPTLPRRPAGVVRIEGKAQGSLTDALIEAYGGSGSSANFEVESSPEDRAFDAFCNGAADIVDSARPISPEEYAACQANGVEPVQIQVASDAAVLAIENETDVGVDCLSLTDVREIFRAASPVTNWSQVGYGARAPAGVDALPIEIAGPDARSNVFGFFGRFVLGDPEPSPILLRSDYQAFPTDHGVRLAVAGKRSEREFAAQRIQSNRSVRQLEAALDDAGRAVAEAEFQVDKGIEDGRSASEQALDSERLAAAEAKLGELEDELTVAELSARRDEEAAVRVARRYGTLGLFRFTYYQLWEERLRPMEVEASGEGGPECIFPSESSVTDGSYPLSRQLLLTVDLEAMKEAEINDFLSFAVANADREAIAEALVPLPDEVRNTELAWLSGEMAPDVVYYPPSQIEQDSGKSG